MEFWAFLRIKFKILNIFNVLLLIIYEFLYFSICFSVFCCFSKKFSIFVVREVY